MANTNHENWLADISVGYKSDIEEVYVYQYKKNKSKFGPRYILVKLNEKMQIQTNISDAQAFLINMRNNINGELNG